MTNTCPDGTQYYTCDNDTFGTNPWKGCCWTNACLYSDGCPDQDVIHSIQSSNRQALNPTTTEISNDEQTPTVTLATSRSTTFVTLNTALVVVGGETSSVLISGTLSDASTQVVFGVDSNPTTAVSSRIPPTSPSSSSSSSSATSASSTPSSAPPSDDSNTSAAAGGAVGGFVGFALIALAIWLLIRWLRSRKQKDIERYQHEDDTSLQGRDAEKDGNYADKHDGPSPFPAELVDPGPREMVGSPVSPLSQVHSPGLTPTSATHRHPEYTSTVLSVSPGFGGQSSNPPSPQVEMPGEPARSISELSNRPERSPINTPSKRYSVNASVDANGNHEGNSGSASSIESLAHSNLEGGKKPARDTRHVMSWMNYDDRTPGLER